jgi:hypothetical protein
MKKVKKFMTTKLDRMIAELCPNGVELVKLGEIITQYNFANEIDVKDYTGTIEIWFMANTKKSMSAKQILEK